jgi:hypothetical protein
MASRNILRRSLEREFMAIIYINRMKSPVVTKIFNFLLKGLTAGVKG